MTGDTRLLLSTVAPVRRRLLVAVLLGAAASASAVALTATSGWLIARAAQHPPVLTLMVAAVAVRVFGIGRGVLRYAERLVSHDAALRGLAELRARVFAALVPLAPVGLRDARRGDLLTRLVTDVEAVEDLDVRVIVPVASAAIVGVAAVGFTAVLLPAAAVSLIAALLAGGVGVPCVVLAADRRASRRTAEARAALAIDVVDLVDGAAELTAFGAMDAAVARAAAADRRLAQLERRTAAGLAAGTGLSALAAGAALWSALAIGIPAVRAGAIAGVLFVVVVLLAWAAPEAVSDLAAVGQYVTTARRAAARLSGLFDLPAPVSEPDRSSAVPVQPQVVSLRDVAARYAPSGPLVLDGLDLELRRGRRVVVTGASGCGKSTLVAVLLRFLEIEKGVMCIDGTDAATLRGCDVRAVIGCCEQQPYLFDSTIRANLLIGAPTADDEQLRSALRRVGLADWLGQLPEGLDTRVGENGAAVSGGQLRRIALARVLLADLPFVLFDEPTEGLDEAAAAALMDDVLAATRDRGVLLVTHRLTGVRADDEVLHLHDGRTWMRPAQGALAPWQAAVTAGP